MASTLRPLFILSAFALLSKEFMHLDPERKKANEKTVAYALFWLLYSLPAGGKWIYHFTIALVWFIAMNLAVLLMQGKMNEKLVGWVVTFAALYTFATTAILWSMPVGMQGPF